MLDYGSFDVPFISDDLKTIVMRQVPLKNIRFGIAVKERLTSSKTETFKIPFCDRAFVRGVYYTSQVEIPYTLSISYTNNYNTEWSTVHGHFKGTIVSNIR